MKYRILIITVVLLAGGISFSSADRVQSVSDPSILTEKNYLPTDDIKPTDSKQNIQSANIENTLSDGTGYRITAIPPNDNCTNASTIGDVSNYPFSTIDATPDGPGFCITSGNIWYLYTATCNGVVNVSLCGSEFDTRLAIYNGSDCPISPNLPAPVELEGGEDISNAVPIITLPVSYTGNTDDNLDDYTESCPYPAGGGKDVVYSYTPSASGYVTISLCNSDFDTRLFVYDSNPPDSGNPIACNEDYCGVNAEISGLMLSSGTTYYIVVDGYNGLESGDYQIDMYSVSSPLILCNDDACGSQSEGSFIASSGNQYLIEIGGSEPGIEGDGSLTIRCDTPPANDECVNASQINGPFPASVSSTTFGATVDCPESFNRAAVWYRFSAPYSQNEVTIDYCLTENDQIDFATSILYSNCPTDEATCNDFIDAYKAYFINCPNGYRNAFHQWLNLPGPATYYFPVSFNVASDFGFTINITPYVPAVVTCPGSAQQEQEICGNNTNGGCLMEPGTESFESISCETDVCGTYWSNYHTRDTDWYEIILAEGGFLKWSAVGEAPTRIWMYDGSGGCDGIFLGSIGVDPGDTASLELEIPAGTYWLVVGTDGWFDMPCNGSGIFTNDYVASVECELGTPQLSAIPSSINGDAYIGFADIETLSVSNSGTGRLNFVAEAIQDMPTIFIDDNSNNRNTQLVNDYYLADIRQFLSPVAPEDISQHYENIPQVMDIIRNRSNNRNSTETVDCPPDAIYELENCGDDTNGGCAMTPGAETFETINCNTTVCGTVWSNNSMRDTDWYMLELTEPSLFSFKVTAEFPLLTVLLLPGPAGDECNGYEAIYFASAAANDTAIISSSMPAGTYLLWVGPAAWFDQPCNGSGEYGNDYVASVSCGLPWLTIDILSGTVHQGDPAVDITVHMDATYLDPGIYTGKIKLSSNDINSPLNVPVTFTVNMAYEYLPGDINMGQATWPAVVDGADATYLVSFFRILVPRCEFDGFYASADPNGDCSVNGADLSYLIAFFRSQVQILNACPLYPHIDPVEERYPACILVPTIDLNEIGLRNNTE